MDYAEADKLVQELSTGFETLQNEYQKLFGRHEALKRKLANTRDQVSPPVPDITPSPYLCPDEQTLALELQSFTDGDR